jgi:hypothetical protein
MKSYDEVFVLIAALLFGWLRIRKAIHGKHVLRPPRSPWMLSDRLGGQSGFK